MKTAMVIPAKGTSERVKNKNLAIVGGKSLVYRACEKALECKEVDYVYLDTECPNILANVEDLISRGLRVINRPAALATNDCNANDLLMWALHTVEDVDAIFQTFSTSPLITAKTMDRVIREWKNSEGYDSFFTVTETREYFWKDGAAFNFDPISLPNSQNLEPLWMETHGLYGVTTESLVKYGKRVGKNPLLIPVSKIESLDIDDQDDLDIASSILEQRGE